MSSDCRVLAFSNSPIDEPRIARLPRGARKRPKLIFLVTEDWYFWSHRLPIARAARDAGFEVVVAARERVHGDRIRGEGFRLEPLGWRRRGDRIVGAGRAVAGIAALYRRERPDIVHHVALKPVLFGGAALRLAFPRRAERPACIAAVNGLGSGFTPSEVCGGERHGAACPRGGELGASAGCCDMPRPAPGLSCRTRKTGRRSRRSGSTARLSS